MSAPGRATRGRVLVVGTPTGVDDLPQPVIRAENLFDAVGEVTVATAAQPITAVVVPAGLVQGSARIAAEAFRRIDPTVRLILVAASSEELASLDGGANGFDSVLVKPGTDQVRAALGGTGAAPPASPAPPPPLDELGDTDLVEAILAGQTLADRALELITQQTGWTDVALREGDAPDGAEVRFGSRLFGVLTSHHADARRLGPWAAWLARWLALERRYRGYRSMAYHDELTGAWNRRFYHAFMRRVLRRAARARQPVTVLVFDIDDFKLYNDQYGHDAGDDVLRETVRLLESVIRAGDRVCRIGGDEFVVIFADPGREKGSNPPETVEQIAQRFQDQICRMKFPKLGIDAPGRLSVSGGLATYPWDGADAESLLRHADQLALRSKRLGKNVITLGPP